MELFEDTANKTILNTFETAQNNICVCAEKICYCISLLITQVPTDETISCWEISRRGRVTSFGSEKWRNIAREQNCFQASIERSRIRNKKLAKKKKCRETVFTKMCRAQAAYATRRHSFRPVSLSLSPLWSIRAVLFPFLSLSISFSLSLPLSRPPARIFFFNLIYRQFDGRKTRRHFCLSPYSPAGPGPSFHPHVARRKAIKIHNPGHTPRG